GTFAFTKNESHERADVYVRTKAVNQSNKEQDIEVENIIYDTKGKMVSRVSQKYNVKAQSKQNIFQKTTVKQPNLWSPKHPYLYKIVTKIKSDGKLADTYTTPLGIRWFKFTADSGFYLNGKHLQLRGMNIHAGFG